MPQFTKADVARQYRDKYGEEMPTLKLARIMYEENKLLFKNVEDARYRLRYIEGKTGGPKRKDVKKTHHLKKEDRPKNPYSFPEPESDDLVPYLLGWKDFVVAGDFHIPNHRLPPIEAMIEYAKEHGIKRLLINGDLLDNTPFTRHPHEPVSTQDVKRWFDQTVDFLKAMKKVFPEIIWLEGNHDFWYHRWLMSKCELLFGDNYYKLESRLGLRELGVTFLDQSNLIKAGHLFISHGHILVKSGGVTAAKRVLDKSGASHLINHLHTEQSFTKSDLTGKIYTGFVVGCMCTLTPEYQRYGGQSCHGFAHVTVSDGGNFKVRNYRIYNGKIL